MSENSDLASLPLEDTAHPRDTKAYISLYLSLKSRMSLGYTLSQIPLKFYLSMSYIGR